MHILVAVLLLTVPVLGQMFSDLKEQWEDWKSKYQKNYQDQGEMVYRRMVWENNLKLILKHNQEASAGLHTFTMGLNHLADMTTEEFSKLNGCMMEDRIHFENVSFDTGYSGSLGPVPRTVDWRKEGWVTPVRNQKKTCGSCWAFAAVGSLEGQMKRKTGKLIPLSPQNLVDCSTEDGNHGCKGGWPFRAFNYIKRNGGIDSENFYPYEATDWKGCRYSGRGKAAYCSGYWSIPSGSESNLTYAVAGVGPVSVCIFANLTSFLYYEGEEFSKLNGCMMEDRIHFENVSFDTGYSGSLGPVPRTVDWRKEGWVTPVRNQKKTCGSCWAFAAVGSLEGQMKRKTGKLIPLSPQNLVDCSTEDGNHGCKGGWPFRAFNYIKRNGGIDSENFYPYEATDWKGCRYSGRGKAAYCSGYWSIPSGSESNLTYAVAGVGPVSVCIFANLTSFLYYEGGVYADKACRSTFQSTHCVLVVGYGTYKGQDYWLVKNSWGTGWGEDGYIRMARNKNLCGIANYADYPIV